MIVYLAAIGLFWLPVREQRASANPPFQLRLYSVADGTELAMLDDPSLLALPSSQGFSRPALAQTMLSPIPPPNWQERPEILPHPAAASNNRSLITEPSLQTRLQSAFDRFVPLSQEEPLNLSPLPSAQTTFVISPLKTERRLLQPASLPLLEASAPSQPTILRLSVNNAGAVTAVLISKSCGNESADLFALRELRRWHFIARSDALDDELDWLETTIHWAGTTENVTQPTAESPKPATP